MTNKIKSHYKTENYYSECIPLIFEPFFKIPIQEMYKGLVTSNLQLESKFTKN